jgi:chromate transporter
MSQPVSFGQAARLWLKLGLLSFGGPAGQIAMLHRLVVEERKWIDNERFLHALNYCHLLPGPEAQQLATYVGWLLHGTRGGLVAGTLFVLPGALVVLALSALYAAFRQVPAVEALFYGLKPAVLAVVLAAVLRLGGKALGSLFGVLLAAGSFLALFLYQTPFPLVIAAAALLGFLARKTCPDVLGNACPGWLHAQATGHGSGEAETPGPERSASLAGSLRILGLWLTLWLGPVAALVLALGPENVFSRLAVFFSKMAVVTFGGAYAVLAYVAQEAVQGYGWLSAADMLNGLGLAETTPGPLILVLQFVGYLAAFRDPGALTPVLAGILGSALTLWVTFAPCFLWIFLGAPYIERLRGVRGLSAALSGITAAVVGVVLNLAVWFGLHTLFGRMETVPFLGGDLPLPQWSSLDPAALVLALGALAAMRLLRLGLAPTLGLCALAGLLWKLLA